MQSKGDSGQVALLAVSVALAAQIPTTIQAIPDAVVRAVVMVLTLLAVVVCALVVQPRKVASVIRDSLRPPAETFKHFPPPRIEPPRFDEVTPEETPHTKKLPKLPHR